MFEVGTRGKAATANAALMKERRKALAKAVERAGNSGPSSSTVVDTDQGGDDGLGEGGNGDVEMADEEDIAVRLLNTPSVDTDFLQAVFHVSSKKSNNFRDEDYYMSHYQKDAITEKGFVYSIYS